MKMKQTLAFACVLAALGATALTAAAQDDSHDGPPGGGGPGGPRGFGHHRHPPLPVVLALDTNHDGIIDAQEIANASAALLTLDKDGNGVLTTNEYLPPMPPNLPPGAPPRPPTPLIIKALDANGDGIIDATEIANAPGALKALDTNGDGVLTRDEFIGQRPHPPGGGRGGPDGHDNEAGGPPPDGAPAGPPPADN
jgi:hypothetical protein